MNGAESLVRTLVGGGVNVCFTNPGTSEMHFVAALDKVDGMRCVLGLFEGIVTGAADGYGRMTDKPAATLLHLGPGLGNGIANLHNAKKAASPVVNIVGEHASFHIKYDAPLTADIEGIARPVSHWVKTSPSAKTVAADGAAAIAAASAAPGQIATLILPADTAWNEADGVAAVPAIPARPKVDEAKIRAAADILKSGKPTLILMTGHVLLEKGLALAGAIAAKTGAKLLTQLSNKRLERGAGRVPVLRVPYVVDMAVDTLKGFQNILLVGAKPPVSFFGYPDKPSEQQAPGTVITRLVELDEDAVDALARLADLLGAKEKDAPFQESKRPPVPTGAITLDSLAASLGAHLPEGAIVVDESVTTGRGFFPLTAGAPPHDWLNNMGGSIGFGTPVGTGAAVACPTRKVICLVGDGSAMYTIQSLWTQARENLDVTTIIFANGTYQILKGELAQVGAGNPGRKAMDMLEIGRPDLNFVDMARGMGVPGRRVTTIDEFNKALQSAMQESGPKLIEVMMR